MKTENAVFKFREKNRRRKEERSLMIERHGEIRGRKVLSDRRRQRRSYLNGAFGNKSKESINESEES